MGIPLEIFSLYQLVNEGTKCQHYLLLRVGQPAFSNADEGDYAHVVDIADRKRSQLIAAYQAGELGAECPSQHTVSLVGELQTSPTGDELAAGQGGCYVDLWVAETRFGHPWVVLGTADSEAAFWHEIAQDDDLARLGAIRPAKRQRAFFLTEQKETISGDN